MDLATSVPSSSHSLLITCLIVSLLVAPSHSQTNRTTTVRPTPLPQVFALEPSDRTAIVGADAVLSCRVINKAGTLQWTRDGFGLGSDRELKGFPRYVMTGSDDEGEFSLHINHVTLEDDALFQCQVGAANGVKGIRSRTAQFTVFVPPEPPQIVQGDYLKTTAGVTVELTCESNGGKPPAELKWLDGDGNEISSNVEETKHPLPDGKRANSAIKWTFTPSREHDGKNFSCRAENPALSQPLYARIRLEVKYAPEISLTVDKERIKEKEPVTFTCDAKANPADVVYKWYRNDEIVLGDHTTTYTIPHVTKEFNKDSVSCEVSNSVGTSKATQLLQVEYGPIFKETTGTVAADVGSDVTLTCEVDGNPKPDIVWQFEKSPNILGNERDLLISDVSQENAGQYFCKASVPDFPVKTATITLYIKGPPKIISEPVQFGSERETIEIVCIINSVPPPTKVMWYRNNQHVDIDNNEGYEKKEEKTKDGVISRLLKHNAEDKDFGVYNCTVRNDFGYDSMFIRINKQKNLPILLILAGVIGGIVFVVSFTIIIVLCLRKKAVIKDEEYDGEKKHKANQHSGSGSDSGSSSGGSSDLKAEIRTTSSLSNPAERSWELDATTQDGYPKYHPPGDYAEPAFPPKPESQSNNGYIPYVDYSRDYNPPAGIPPPSNGGIGALAGSRDSGLYGSSPHSLADLTLDPRYRAAYANPYLRTPTSSPPPPPPPPPAGVVYVTSWNSENINNVVNSCATTPVSNHYITSQQAQLKPGTLATHV